MSTGIEKYDFRYECTPSNIDINTLLLSQLHFVSAITEIQKNLYPNCEFKIKVEAPKDGSFIFQQIYEAVNEQTLFSKENVEYAANLTEVTGFIFAGLFSIYKLRKHLKGAKAKEEKNEGDFVNITNNEGTQILIDKKIFLLYKSNPTINIAINNHFQVIENDDNINGIGIKSQTNNDTFFNISKEEFTDFTTPNEYLSNDTLEKPKQGQRVYIKKPDLIPKKKKVVWSVIYDSREIKAVISDLGFISKINNGLRVAQGDSMLVDMKIISVLDKIYNTHIDKVFEITKVIDYYERLPPEKQLSIM